MQFAVDLRYGFRRHRAEQSGGIQILLRPAERCLELPHLFLDAVFLRQDHGLFVLPGGLFRIAAGGGDAKPFAFCIGIRLSAVLYGSCIDLLNLFS